MPQGPLSWELPARPPEPEDPLWFSIALNLILVTMTVELGALAYYLLKLAR